MTMTATLVGRAESRANFIVREPWQFGVGVFS